MSLFELVLKPVKTVKREVAVVEPLKLGVKFNVSYRGLMGWLDGGVHVVRLSPATLSLDSHQTD